MGPFPVEVRLLSDSLSRVEKTFPPFLINPLHRNLPSQSNTSRQDRFVRRALDHLERLGKIIERYYRSLFGLRHEPKSASKSILTDFVNMVSMSVSAWKYEANEVSSSLFSSHRPNDNRFAES